MTITRRRLVGSGLLLSGSGALAAACGTGGAGGPSVPAKQVRTGVTLNWLSYVNNEPLHDEINKIWTAKHPQVKLSHTFSTAAEIGAATGIEFLGDGGVRAAAEPVRRGGGSAMVEDPG